MNVATSREAELDAMKRGKSRESCHHPHHHLQLGLVPSGDSRASMLEEMDGLFLGGYSLRQILRSWNLHINGRIISVSIGSMVSIPTK